MQAEEMRLHQFPQGIVYISLSSQAKYELCHRGLAHVNAHDLCDLEALFRETDQQYDDLRHQCATLDDFLQQENPELIAYGIRPFFFNYYQAKILLDVLKQRSFMIKAAYDKFGDTLYAFAPDVKSWGRYMKLEDRFTGMVLHAFLGSENIIARDRPVPRCRAADGSAFDALVARSVRGYKHRFRYILKRAKRVCGRKIAGLRSARNFYSLSPVIPDQSLATHKLSRITPHIEKSSSSASYSSSVFDHAMFLDMVSYAGPFSRPILESWFTTHVLSQIPEIMAQAKHLDSAITRDNPLLLESRTYFSPEEQLAATQFRRHNKKVVGTQHGSLGIQNEKIFGIGDLQYVSDYFVWGTGVRDYITDQYPFALGHKFSTHVSGTGHFDTEACLTRQDLCRLFEIPEDKTIVLMPGSGFAHNIFYNWYLLMSEQQEYENQTKLIDFFATRSDCVFLYKGLRSAHYDERHVAQYIEAKKCPNLIYMQKTPLRQILPAIDVFITDRPSTSLLEALALQKICYSYNRWLSFPGDSFSLYKRAVQHFSEPDALLEKFAVDIAHKFSDVPHSLDYYKAYGNGTTNKQRHAIFTAYLRERINEEKAVAT